MHRGRSPHRRRRYSSGGSRSSGHQSSSHSRTGSLPRYGSSESQSGSLPGSPAQHARPDRCPSPNPPAPNKRALFHTRPASPYPRHQQQRSPATSPSPSPKHHNSKPRSGRHDHSKDGVPASLQSQSSTRLIPLRFGTCLTNLLSPARLALMLSQSRASRGQEASLPPTCRT